MSGKYTATYLGREGPEPQNYRWAIRHENRWVAEYGHDFRNDGRWLTIGYKTIAVAIDFLTGGPEPITVTEDGARLLDQLSASN